MPRVKGRPRYDKSFPYFPRILGRKIEEILGEVERCSLNTESHEDHNMTNSCLLHLNSRKREGGLVTLVCFGMRE